MKINSRYYTQLTSYRGAFFNPKSNHNTKGGRIYQYKDSPIRDMDTIGFPCLI